MSQVRKLLQGNKIPKAQEGYKFILDGVEYNVTDDQLKEIDDRLSKIEDIQIRQELSNWTNGIKSGQGYGNILDNTAWEGMLRDDFGRDDEKRLREKKATTGEALFKKRSWYAKHAINEALNVTKAVLTKAKPIDSNMKRRLESKEILLDFNEDENGNLYLSPINYGVPAKRVSDVLAHLQAGDKSEYSSEGWDFTNIQNWLNGLEGEDKYAAASSYFTKLWADMQKPGYKISPDLEDLLSNFKITSGKINPDSETEDSKGIVESPLDDNNRIIANKKNSDGTWIVFKGNGKDGYSKDELYTTFSNPDKRPYLLNKDRLQFFGLDDSYLNSVIYENRIYKPEEVAQNVQLKAIMDNVIRANNSAHDINDIFDKSNPNSVSSLLNFTDYGNDYISYNSDINYMPYKYHQLRSQLGNGVYAIFNPTRAYDMGDTGNEIFGVYDFNSPGNDTWGFRTPNYYINGNDSLTGPTPYIPQGYTFLNRNWDPMNAYSEWQDINGDGYKYGLVGNFWGADAHDMKPYSIYERKDGTFWHKSGNGQLVQLDNDLVEAIINGSNDGSFKPNHNQMLYGTLSGKPKTEMRTNWMPQIPWVFKEGGQVKLKSLPQKFQMGSKLASGIIESEPTSEPQTPLGDASNVWETLTPADKKEITAAAIDVAGAMANLAGPIGSIAGAVSGIGVSTPLFMSAAKQRKGHLDLSDWGQAGLATMLDLVSLVPYLGEVGKITKIAKSVSRVAIPLGKAFSVLGLGEAMSVLNKNPKDWDTNDLLKLSAGIQSVINIGHGMHVRRGESALASEISKTIGTEPTKPSHKFKIGNNEIQLSKSEIDAISNHKNNAEEVLKGILRGKGVKDEDLADVSKLLDAFGFNTSKKGVFKNRRVVADVKEPEQPTKYTKTGYIWDELLDPLGHRERARRAYIDENFSKVKNNPEFRNKVFNVGETVSTNKIPREDFTEIITDRALTPKTGLGTNAAMARAYLQSLARTNSPKVVTSWTSPIELNPKNNTSTTVYREPTTDFIVRKAGESLEDKSDVVKQMTSQTRELFDNVGSIEQQISKAVSTRVPNLEPKNLGRVQNLGANAMSNKELRRYIIGNVTEKGLSEQEAVEFINNLSSRKRISLLKELQKSRSNKVKSILDNFDENGNLQMSTKKVFDVARTKLARMAVNLKKLRESSNPMQTLSELSSDSETIDVANMNPEQFRDALNEALRNTIYKRFTGPRLDRNIKKIEQFRKNSGFEFKEGGIIKAQLGTITPEDQKEIDDQFAYSWKSILANNGIKSDSSMGGLTKNGKDHSKWLLPALSLARFGINSAFQNKYYKQELQALEAGRYNEKPITLNTPDSNNPALDRALRQVNSERLIRIKPVTSDWVQHNALSNQRESQLWDREQSLLSQRSQYDHDIKNEILNIENQNNANYINTANQNAARNAAINSAKKQAAMELTQRRAQSWENLGLEMQNNLYKDRQTMLNYNRAMEAQRLDKEYQDRFDELFPGARAAYQSLPYNEAVKYADLEDFVRQHPDYQKIYNQNIDNIADLQTARINGMNAWLYQNGLNYSYPRWLTGWNSPIGKNKKGGRINGNTRYRLEPDEQIWVDNNKAAHAAIAKLSESTIKLLLRALK